MKKVIYKNSKRVAYSGTQNECEHYMENMVDISIKDLLEIVDFDTVTNEVSTPPVKETTAETAPETTEKKTVETSTLTEKDSILFVLNSLKNLMLSFISELEKIEKEVATEIESETKK
jgi:hypothetical protein